MKKAKDKSLNIGVIGCGYWGPKLIRNFASLSNCTVKKASDVKPGRLEFVKKEFPFVETTRNHQDIIKDKNIQAVCISTPVSTHKDLAEEAMFFGKHVFVEKPLTLNSEDAESLVYTAKKLKKRLAVGHVFQFAPAVRKIKSMIKSKLIGDILHIASARINLGPPETEVDVIWDLGPHDFSIILHILDEIPWKVTSSRNEYSFNGFNEGIKSKTKQKKLINNAHIDLSFKSGTTAHVHLSWLSSNKVRLMQIFGTKGTIIYDEMLALDGKVKLYGKGIDNRLKAKATDSAKLDYSTGEIQIVQLEQHEPLRMECQEFVDSVLFNKPLINDGEMGLQVVRLLETATESFNKNI